MTSNEKEPIATMTDEQKLNFAATLESFKATNEFGLQTMKSLFIISGGSAAALLAFMGHLVTNGAVVQAKDLSMTLCIFFLATLLGSGGIGVSYLSQGWYTADNNKFGNAARVIAIFFVFAAYICCFAGMVSGYLAFMRF